MHVCGLLGARGLLQRPLLAQVDVLLLFVDRVRDEPARILHAVANHLALVFARYGVRISWSAHNER